LPEIFPQYGHRALFRFDSASISIPSFPAFTEISRKFLSGSEYISPTASPPHGFILPGFDFIVN
jgi:hypothetical protein